MPLWLPFVAALVYVAILFVVAERVERRAGPPRRPLTIYALSLGVYCTAWTFFGGVGAAATQGWDFLPIYLGPALVFLLAPAFLVKIAQAAKAENATSIADFIAARYGKSRTIAALVSALALLGAIPYIALQLKSIGMSAGALLHAPVSMGATDPVVLIVALSLAVFSIMFGARRFDAAGRNRGLVVAIAVESAVKLAALAAVGAFAVLVLAEAPAERVRAASARFADLFHPAGLDLRFFTITLLSMAAIVCLPRQFYIGFLEALSPQDLRRARWPFVTYLAGTAIVVIPITLAGLAVLPSGTNPDLYVLRLPLDAGVEALALLVFVGGFSAATSMVIAATVALSIMVSNDLIAPFLLKRPRGAPGADMGRLLLAARRGAIVAIILLAWIYHQVVDSRAALAAMGLVAFAAVAQFAPALIAGLYWPRASRIAAKAGLTAGLVLWAYTLLLPSVLGDAGLAASGLTRALGGLIHPQALLGLGGLDPLTHGALWSLGLNIVLLVAVSWRAKQGMLVPRPHATGRFGPAATLGDLRALAERFVGVDRAADAFEQAAFERGRSFAPSDPIDRSAARLAERLIAGVIGAPSARVIVASALSGVALDVDDVVGLLDGASQELQFSRELLSATMNSISQGVSVVDKDLRLVAWNATYLSMFEFPPGFIQVGRPIADVIRFNAERGECGPGEVEDHVARRLANYRRAKAHVFERARPNGMVLKTMGNPMPGGGYVTTFTDISAEKRAQAALEAVNERLEERVAARTAELSREADLNRRLAADLARAHAVAERATQSKTRFLAAASHDLMQPLHAARLFAAALEQSLDAKDEQNRALVRNVDRSIASADTLLRSLLDVSRLDGGGYQQKPTVFAISGLIEELVAEFEPMAAEKGLVLRTAGNGFDPTVRCDRVLLRQIVQNFVANAIRYTGAGSVLIACRRRVGEARIEVWDTGPGIPGDKLDAIFEEFTRLDAVPGVRGVGLGLAIARRAADLTGAVIAVRSRPGRGSVFSVALPIAKSRAAPERRTPDRATPPPPGLRVLCVDNDPVILEGLAAMLAGWGVEPRMAPSFNAALTAIAEGPFDLALVDQHLDGPETGIDVLAALRATQTHVPAALVTADAGREAAAAARAFGARVLAKPLDPDVLRVALAEAARLRTPAE